jgi:D-methionine transport system ATP-binding protein
MIELIQLEKHYSTAAGSLHALKHINLHVKPGKICGIIGKSGAGKSSLIRCVNLLERPTSGAVKIDGQDLTALSPKQLRNARHDISMIFQHFNLLSSYTAYQNVALPLVFKGLSKTDIHTRVQSLLELVGLSDKTQHYPAQLSGGEKQRVAIARALSTKPKVLLCDEGTSALDPYTTKSILNLLSKINKKLNLTILLITHEMDVVKEICDDVVVLNQGEIIEQTNTLDFFMYPKTAIGKLFCRSSLHQEFPQAV